MLRAAGDHAERLANLDAQAEQRYIEDLRREANGEGGAKGFQKAVQRARRRGIPLEKAIRKVRIAKTLLKRLTDQQPPEEKTMGVANPKGHGSPCSVCHQPLRADNASGVHTRCKGKEAASPKKAVRAKAPTLKASEETDLTFDTLAEALGFDAESLISEFKAAWVEKARSSARAALVGDVVEVATGSAA